jgi:hypothetical protein
LASPLYCAVKTFAPFASVVLVTVAVPCAKNVLELTLPVTATGEPKLVPFSRNCTVPLGSCAALAVALLVVDTVAVIVTGCPAAVDIGIAVTAVVVAALVMVIVAVAGPLGLKLLSPE